MSHPKHHTPAGGAPARNKTGAAIGTTNVYSTVGSAGRQRMPQQG